MARDYTTPAGAVGEWGTDNTAEVRIFTACPSSFLIREDPPDPRHLRAIPDSRREIRI